MRKLFLSLVIPVLLALPSKAFAGELKLSINGGLVTLIAEDVPLSAILAEWGRVGQTKIVNGEQIFTRVSFHIENMPERRALDIILRSAAGYMAAERPVPVAGASAFDRIMILPTSRPPANTAPIMTAPPPAFAPPRPTPVPEAIEDDPMSVPPPGVMPPGMNPNQPNPNQMMPPQPGMQAPQGPLTAPRPGQLPAPAPQQPVPFGAPRPGGGPGGVGPGGTNPGGSGGSGAQF
ncbi:MAG TPA: hypothetical protein VM364_07655 [Vicinamibacterales bacterium]|nr:hypothetical protein [Vicinamibacterales bacterium]